MINKIYLDFLSLRKVIISLYYTINSFLQLIISPTDICFNFWNFVGLKFNKSGAIKGTPPLFYIMLLWYSPWGVWGTGRVQRLLTRIPNKTREWPPDFKLSSELRFPTWLSQTDTQTHVNSKLTMTVLTSITMAFLAFHFRYEFQPSHFIM